LRIRNGKDIAFVSSVNRGGASRNEGEETLSGKKSLNEREIRPSVGGKGKKDSEEKGDACSYSLSVEHYLHGEENRKGRWSGNASVFFYEEAETQKKTSGRTEEVKKGAQSFQAIWLGF